MESIGILPYVLIGTVGLGAALVFRNSLRALFRLLTRTAAGLGALALFSNLGNALGITLGVNLLNALILAFLGIPGFGLLMLLHWAFPA